ncbi:SCO family protein [Flavobacterium sp. NKUCC04_CG]|uniref:SCO family protein n=1 Tax=Flavobacterium sp. NKUCC04_CG TaxID=2842121 RepID=UPI001C5BCD5D|nr:SCO family protein [Flavobacterium sp. NKUCC04_CG]MBW3517730.1 SCO family protein [Flavobacterium sp. NKUCC04_CG]
MKNVLLISFILIFISCTNADKLPYLGNHNTVMSKNQTKVIQHFKVPDFNLTNQEGIAITNASFNNKIYIADFIFLKCPTICPIMNQQLKRVYDVFKKNKEVLFVSHTIDPENDSIPVLKAYSEQLGVDSKKWHFLHGEKKDIYKLAEQGYYTQAYQEPQAPGGYAHSGGFILVDENRHLRGVYDGTNAADVDRLIKEIVILLKEKSK